MRDGHVQGYYGAMEGACGLFPECMLGGGSNVFI